jgi:NAD(P)-dependent dehydrogenase (short-subunit alcohol dehydrogenase family)
MSEEASFKDGPKTALVSGAAKRIGRAIALGLAKSGWAVAIHYNGSKKEAESLVAEIEADGGRACALKADLAREDETSHLIPQAVEKLGPLTLLVNNASVFKEDTPQTTTRQSWDIHMEVNLRAAFVLSQAFYSQLPEEFSGNIINIIDQRVWNLTPHFTSYTLSKAGLWTLTQTLAMALAPRVRVNAIGPGPTLPSARQSEDDFARQSLSTPLQKKVSPEEIADAVRFILDASSLSGQMMALDAGQHLGWASPSGVKSKE